MTSQPTLFDPGPADGALTARQQAAYDTVRDAGGDGVSSDEIGAVLHELRQTNPHSRGERCMFCGKDGRSVLEALKSRGLVQRNRLGVYRTTNKRPEPAAPVQGQAFGDTGDDIPY